MHQYPSAYALTITYAVVSILSGRVDKGVASGVFTSDIIYLLASGLMYCKVRMQ